MSLRYFLLVPQTDERTHNLVFITLPSWDRHYLSVSHHGLMHLSLSYWRLTVFMIALTITAYLSDTMRFLLKPLSVCLKVFAPIVREV